MPAVAVLNTDSAAIKTTPGQLVGVVLTHSAAAQVTLKDGGSSGTAILGVRLGGAGTVSIMPAMPIAFGNLYLTVDSGTAPQVTVVYV